VENLTGLYQVCYSRLCPFIAHNQVGQVLINEWLS